jgi:hypothetical protein
MERISGSRLLVAAVVFEIDIRLQAIENINQRLDCGA